jgi:mRNA-degrading endonuclease toxin of MazEF toxin-antitoxin module
MQRGEVWRVRIPFAPGHAQAGERPAVILQDAAYGAALPTVLVVPFTGTLAAARYPGALLIQPDGQNGLTVPSVALAFQLRVLDRRHCLQRLGALDAKTLDDLLTQLDRLTGR